MIEPHAAGAIGRCPPLSRLACSVSIGTAGVGQENAAVIGPVYASANRVSLAGEPAGWRPHDPTVSRHNTMVSAAGPGGRMECFAHRLTMWVLLR